MKTTKQELKIKVSEMALFEQRWPFLNPSRVYYAYFEAVPNYIICKRIEYIKAKNWVEGSLSDQILKVHSRRELNDSSCEIEITDIIYILKNQLLIKIEQTGCIFILYIDKSKEMAEVIAEGIKNFKKTYTSKLSTFIETNQGLILFDIKSKKPKLSITGNYNEDLSSLHIKILKELKKKDSPGLFLFHGIPGTGKSTYIRYLIHLLNKRVIFLPSKLAGNLDSPKFLSVLVNQPNTILIIEDAEDLLTSREKGNDSSISMLLNLTDGMLGESLGIQVICTFNSTLINIDKALLRKGRLKAMYEFKPLNVIKSLTLLKNLNISDNVVKEPMTLADIYNIKEQNFEFNSQNHKFIGFAQMT